MKKLKKGDKVKVLLGKDRGRQGVIEKLVAKKGMAYVAGINTYKRHVKKQGQVEGGIIEIIKPLNLSKLALVCPNCQKVTRVKFKTEGEKKLRVCNQCKVAV